MNYKYAFIILILFVACFAVTNFLHRSTIVKEWLERKTSVQFSSRSHDLGLIPSRESASVYFSFTNVGPNELKIEGIETRCGCTVTKWPTEPIGPGQQDSILVEYDAETTGFFLKEVYVFSNAETSPDLLSIRGTVQSEPPDTSSSL